jgi:hypothetical protein
MNQTTWIILITKGILHDRTMRRNVLFWIVVAALALLGAGAVVLDSWLSQHPILFLLYWGACLWLTLTSALLALYDALAVRAEALRERQELKRRILDDPQDGDPSNP